MYTHTQCHVHTYTHTFSCLGAKKDTKTTKAKEGKKTGFFSNFKKRLKSGGKTKDGAEVATAEGQKMENGGSEAGGPREEHRREESMGE